MSSLDKYGEYLDLLRQREVHRKEIKRLNEQIVMREASDETLKDLRMKIFREGGQQTSSSGGVAFEEAVGEAGPSPKKRKKDKKSKEEKEKEEAEREEKIRLKASRNKMKVMLRNSTKLDKSTLKDGLDAALVLGEDLDADTVDMIKRRAGEDYWERVEKAFKERDEEYDPATAMGEDE